MAEWVSYPINEHRTPRRCAYCALPAKREDYRVSLNGSLDKSSRRFTCGNDHPDGSIAIERMAYAAAQARVVTV